MNGNDWGIILAGIAGVLGALTGLVKVFRTPRSTTTSAERAELTYLRSLVIVLRTNGFRLLSALNRAINGEKVIMPVLEPEPVDPAAPKPAADPGSTP